MAMVVVGCAMLFSVTLLPFMLQLQRPPLAFLPVWLVGVILFGLWAGSGALIGAGISNLFGRPMIGAAIGAMAFLIGVVSSLFFIDYWSR